MTRLGNDFFLILGQLPGPIAHRRRRKNQGRGQQKDIEAPRQPAPRGSIVEFSQEAHSHSRSELFEKGLIPFPHLAWDVHSPGKRNKSFRYFPLSVLGFFSMLRGATGVLLSSVSFLPPIE